MNTGKRRSPFSYIPGYTNNAVLKLIIISAGAYALLGVTWAIIKIAFAGDESNFVSIFLNNLALPHAAAFSKHWWTVLTYGWFQYPNNFMELLSNMLWLYLFGSVVQMLIGPKQVIPLFFYAVASGGVLFVASQLVPGTLNAPPLLGPKAGMIGIAVAALTLAPNYRFYFTETFSVPISIVFAIFMILILMSTGFYLPMLFLLAGGAATGFAYIKLLKSGFQPSAWMYSITDKVESWVTPSDSFVKGKKTKVYDISGLAGKKSANSNAKDPQKRIDEILDKINQKGYRSLSQEEKDILAKAGKD